MYLQTLHPYCEFCKQQIAEDEKAFDGNCFSLIYPPRPICYLCLYKKLDPKAITSIRTNHTIVLPIALKLIVKSALRTYRQSEHQYRISDIDRACSALYQREKSKFIRIIAMCINDSFEPEQTLIMLYQFLEALVFNKNQLYQHLDSPAQQALNHIYAHVKKLDYTHIISSPRMVDLLQQFFRQIYSTVVPQQAQTSFINREIG